MSCVFVFWCYTVLTFYRYLRHAYISRTRAHNFSLRVSLGGDRLPTQAYAREVLCNFNWICLRGHSLSNIFVWSRTLLQSCSWSNDRIKDNEGEEGHVIIHWVWHGEKTLGNYPFRQTCIEHVERAFAFSPQMNQMKRRKRNLKKKKK